MNRRHFLALAGPAFAALAGSRMPATASAVSADGDVCRTRLTLVSGPVAAGPETVLRYQGTHILTFGALRELGQRFNALNRGSVQVAGGGCDDGITAVLKGAADFGGLCCPVKGSRAEGLPSLLVAHDFKAVIVHRSNPVARIAMRELAAVARGRIGRWREVGGNDRAIALMVRRHCPDFFEPVRSLLLDNRPDWSPRALFVDTDEQIVELTSRYVGGIGVVSWVFAKPLVDAGRLKALAVDGVLPGCERTASRYPLTGPLSLVFRSWQPRRMAPFLDYLYGQDGRAVIAKSLIAVRADQAGYRAISGAV